MTTTDHATAARTTTRDDAQTLDAGWLPLIDTARLVEPGDPRDFEWLDEIQTEHVAALGAWRRALVDLEQASATHDARAAVFARVAKATEAGAHPRPHLPPDLEHARTTTQLRRDSDTIVRVMFAPAKAEQQARAALYATVDHAFALLWQRSAELHRLGAHLTASAAASDRALGARLLQLRLQVVRDDARREIDDVFSAETQAAESLLRPMTARQAALARSTDRTVVTEVSG